jgi:hypothetical protein
MQSAAPPHRCRQQRTKGERGRCTAARNQRNRQTSNQRSCVAHRIKISRPNAPDRVSPNSSRRRNRQCHSSGGAQTSSHRGRYGEGVERITCSAGGKHRPDYRLVSRLASSEALFCRFFFALRQGEPLGFFAAPGAFLSVISAFAVSHMTSTLVSPAQLLNYSPSQHSLQPPAVGH